MHKFDFENSIGFIINRTAKALIHAFDQELRKKCGNYFWSMEDYNYIGE